MPSLPSLHTQRTAPRGSSKANNIARTTSARQQGRGRDHLAGCLRVALGTGMSHPGLRSLLLPPGLMVAAGGVGMGQGLTEKTVTKALEGSHVWREGGSVASLACGCRPRELGHPTGLLLFLPHPHAHVCQETPSPAQTCSIESCMQPPTQNRNPHRRRMANGLPRRCPHVSGTCPHWDPEGPTAVHHTLHMGGGSPEEGQVWGTRGSQASHAPQPLPRGSHSQVSGGGPSCGWEESGSPGQLPKQQHDSRESGSRATGDPDPGRAGP